MGQSAAEVGPKRLGTLKGCVFPEQYSKDSGFDALRLRYRQRDSS
jgi:hypothetical protein